MPNSIHPNTADTSTASTQTPAGEKLTDKFTETAESVRQATAEHSNQLAETVSEHAQTAVSEARATYEMANDKAREVTEKQPLLAIAGAAALGVVVGMAINSRRD